MKGKILYYSLVAVLIFSMLIPTQLQPVYAQAPEPESIAPPIIEQCLPDYRCQNEMDSRNFLFKTELVTKTLDDTKAIGGPDDFGYTWNNTEPFSWVDAKLLGNNSNLYGGDVFTGPIDIGFPFPFYENEYSNLFFSTKGLVSFDSGTYLFSNTPLPSINNPNNIIAVFWDDLGMYQGSRPDSGIFTYSGGISPDRYFVIEWYRADAYSGSGTIGSQSYDLTFEVILHENGDIVMQYLNLSGYLYSATVGIEDSMGYDGLQYLYNSPGLTNGLSILFSYPPPTRRVSLAPSYQGSSLAIGENKNFPILLRNTGDLGSDTYTFDYSSDWEVNLYYEDGMTPLPTSIPLEEGEELKIIANISAPDSATIGESNNTSITATSSDLMKSKSIHIENSIPAPFAQIYSGLNNDKVNLEIVRPETQSRLDITPDEEYGSQPIVKEIDNNNFINVWSSWVNQGVSYGNILKYSIVDKYGNETKSVSNLTNLYSSTNSYYSDDRYPSIAIAPDGKIGIAWTRYISDNTTYLSNYNVWYLLLNPNGTIANGPVNLTNNSAWVTSATIGYKYFYNTSMAASEDNHFMLTWPKRQRATSTTWLYEVTYSVFSSSGIPILAPTKLASGIAGSLEYYSPSITSLTGNRFFVTYIKWQESGEYWTGGSYFRVFNSNGGNIKPETSIPDIYDRILSKELSGGNILLASSRYGYPSIIQYKILNNVNFESIYSSSISHPTMGEYSNGLSITIDNANHGILTWTDSTQKYLYYSLIDANGSVLTEPMIFHSAKDNEYIQLNYYGGSNTSNSWEPLSNLDGLVDLSSTIYGVAPGGSAEISVFYANDGLTTATNVKLSLTLDEGLTYNYDTSGITPSIVGNTVEWDLPDLALLDNDRFMVYLSIPSDAPLGAQYSISFTLSSDGTDSDPENNTFDAIIFSTKHVFLPLIIR